MSMTIIPSGSKAAPSHCRLIGLEDGAWFLVVADAAGIGSFGFRSADELRGWMAWLQAQVDFVCPAPDDEEEPL